MRSIRIFRVNLYHRTLLGRMMSIEQECIEFPCLDTATAGKTFRNALSSIVLGREQSTGYEYEVSADQLFAVRFRYCLVP